ncbi:MAG: type I-D CRISPR-associated helicase Cas3' [Kouleothrix sp.]|jgi:CRISPR-associated endonuclease/helicase Cas3|nr:type I-D CRISPR-associated helicase Cas3' [Kouleothrix sp.]
MTTITLLAHEEKLAPADALPEYRHTTPLLYHQVRTYDALKATPLVMNTYPTGTGKTLAALLRLLHPDQRNRNTLLIAPTNALIDQHAAEAREFIAHHGLKMQVFAANAAALGALDPSLRPGERLQRFLENPLTFAEQLSLPYDAEKQPFVVVTNPDIFYYGLYFQYRRTDQRNVFQAFIGNFHYVVIDEFHYYDNKQFANFLFFFALWKQWSYFTHGRSICLLSATPRANVHMYLDRLFDATTQICISPDNEPPESAGYKTIPTLSELRLTIVADQIESWVAANRQQIAEWQAAQLDSVIISSSLGRINDINALLQQLDPVRITGPEPQSERQRVRPLILATPTVDIGYNFGRPGKCRQSIDRLVCDARFGDELTQRIGRAGRVLGRVETTTPSEAVVIVNDEAADELHAYDTQRLSRSAWAAIVARLQHLPPKHQLDGYIRSHAIMEAFYPIMQISGLLEAEEAALEELYQMIRDVFAPATKQRAISLKRFFSAYDKRRRWLNQSPETKRWLIDEWNGKALAQHFADYVSWRESGKGKEMRYKGAMFRQQLPALLLNQPQQKRALVAFIESQVALTRAIFNFREAYQGPTAAVYDPQHRLSSETVNSYDLLHLAAHYQLYCFPNQVEFKQVTGTQALAEFCVEIQGFRDPKLTLGFDYETAYSPEEFKQRYCRSVVALRGLKLTAKERCPDGMPTQLDQRIRSAIETEWVPCLIVAQESWWPLLSILKGSPFYARQLLVDYTTDGTSEEYKLVTGTAAFHILPELKRHYAMLDKKLSDEPIFV